MHIQKLPFTGRRAEVALAAITLSHVFGLNFTAKSFSAFAKVPLNRHTRSVLTALCEQGVLSRSKRINMDGKYPYTYNATKANLAGRY